MFGHHDLIILVIAMMTTICRAMDIDSDPRNHFLSSTDQLAIHLKHITLDTPLMDIEEDNSMEVDSMENDMEIDELSIFPVHAY